MSNTMVLYVLSKHELTSPVSKSQVFEGGWPDKPGSKEATTSGLPDICCDSLSKENVFAIFRSWPGLLVRPF